MKIRPNIRGAIIPTVHSVVLPLNADT
jgi:hypothetical protein